MSDDEYSLQNNQFVIEHKALSFGKVSFYQPKENEIYFESDFHIEDLSDGQKDELKRVLNDFLQQHAATIFSTPSSFEGAVSGTMSLLLDACLSPTDAHDLRQNLEEMMPIWVERHGPQKAKFILSANVIMTLLGKLMNKVRDVTDMLSTSFPRMD